MRIVLDVLFEDVKTFVERDSHAVKHGLE
jgi:hypothetical protein